jgi:2-acylglycerol O-acyltransferase 2
VLPLRRPINIVIGKPIKVDLNKNIDDRYVNDPHKAYLAGLEKLWDGYKDTYAKGRIQEMEYVSSG